MLKPLFAILCAALLSSCGGGDGNQQINQVKVGQLAYSKAATIYMAGVYLSADMSVSTDACSNPTFSNQSVPELAVLTCTITSTGQHTLTVKGSDGQLLYAGTLTVPQPQVKLSTSKGDLVLELNPTAVPLTVDNFLSYVHAGFYTNTLFHRVIPGFVVQGGGFTAGMVAKSGLKAAIALESNKGLLNNRATVAMARTTAPNSATSQFFINLVKNTSLDYQSDSNPGYAVFGTVVQGMDVIDAIAAVPTGSVNGFSDVPSTDVTITAATQIQ